MYNKTRENLTEEEKAELKKQRAQLLIDVKAIVDTPQGVRFFKYFFDQAFVFSRTMTGNSWTYFNEGRRDLGNVLFELILQVRPELIPDLIVRKEENHE